MNTFEDIRSEVAQASANWIKHFNEQSYEACISVYTDDAWMKSHPFGEFRGIEQIGDFWRNFAKHQPRQLEYRDIRIHVIDERTAILSASWSMNICSGYISKELWIKNDQGQWQLQEDDFLVIMQRETPRTSAEETALVVVDIQNDYFPGGKMPLPHMEAIAERSLKVLNQFRKKQFPIIHIQHVFQSNEAPFFTRDGIGKDIHSDFTPLAGEAHHVKPSLNAFVDTTLEDTLVKLGIRKLVFVGAMAHICVEAVATTASNKGYESVVLADCVTNPTAGYQGCEVSSEEVHAAAMATLGMGYSQILLAEEFLQTLP